MSGHRSWAYFIFGMLVLMSVEFVFSRFGLADLPEEARARRQQRNAVFATLMWVGAALLFAAYIFRAHQYTDGPELATQFLAGYFIEETLSIDNLFVFLLLFRVFAIPRSSQPRALFWGVLGAIVLRGFFIVTGLRLLDRFHLATDLFALILLYASFRLLVPSHPSPTPGLSAQPPFWVRWISRIHPVSPRHDVFFTTSRKGYPIVTMLFLALLAIEVADIIFAVDSIPAVLSITRAPLLAYTSNILAVMSLRSLYFLLTGMLRKLRFLHFGLAAILAFASIRMLLADFWDIAPLSALFVILTILAVTVAASLIAPGRPSPLIPEHQ